MSLQDTPRSNRVHIALFGKRNSGKSSLVNALTGQQVSVVSDVAGTTTDPVYKSMEIHGIGPCVFIDTAGFDDIGQLGTLRVDQTRKALERADIAIMVCSPVDCQGDLDLDDELKWQSLIKEKNIPLIWVVNKADVLDDPSSILREVEKISGIVPIAASAKNGKGIDDIRRNLIGKLPDETMNNGITGQLVSEGDTVLLVMPQDLQAPKGRLILPQVQTIRELLDKKCLVFSCTTDMFDSMLKALSAPPKLIITDSQVFKTVYDKKPEESLLTSFSVLFAQYKGDIEYFIEGAKAISALNKDSRVLIAEACTHAPLTEDIGRVKIPAMLRKMVGDELQIDIVAGTDFPDDLSPYDLIIHCGSCMFNRKYVLNRVARAKNQNVPMTNYGVTIAYIQGILDKISYKI